MPVLHDALPFHVWEDARLARLPGIQPLDPADWLRIDSAYAAQMAERERLIADHCPAVHALLPQAEEAAKELHAMISARLPGLGFHRARGGWRCPDGRLVADAPETPLLTLGRLVQEDLCILQDGPEGRHVLGGAILCFPASWTLEQKIGRDLVGIHRPVASYDEGLARRVQRLFDAIRPEQPLWRANVLDYADPALFQPRREGEARPEGEARRGYIRSERQCLLRLPQSRAVVFSIHTYLIARESLPPEADAAFGAFRPPH
ncbi:MAG: heme-dependent oxidative N-demethylase family protein [Pararhodobacter sp.]